MTDAWVNTTFHEVTTNFDGTRKPLSKAVRSKFHGTYPYYGACEVIDHVKEYLFDGEYILIGEDGANLLSRSKPLSFIANGKFWVNNHAHVVQPKPAIIAKFLNYQFNSIQINEFVTGTAQPKLSQRNLNKIPIRLPAIPIQRAIVSKIETLFSDLDSGIADLKKAQEQLKVYRQAVLKKAFEGIGQKATIRSVCENVKVGIVIKPTRFYTQNNEPEIPAFRSANVREFRIEDSNWVYFTKSGNEENRRTQLKLGDVLVVRSGYPGTSCVVTPKFVGANAIDILVATPNREKITPEYLCAFNNSPLAKGLFSEGVRGVAQKHLNVGVYNKLLLPVPCIDMQKQIVNNIESKLSICEQIEATISDALHISHALKQSILKKAFKGSLLTDEELEKCKEETDYEPASRLLERIRRENAKPVAKRKRN